MSIELVLYLIDVLTSLYNILVTILLFSFIWIIIRVFVAFRDINDFDNDFKIKAILYLKSVPKKIAIIITISVAMCLIPSDKTMYMMIGANYLKNSQLPSKVELAIEKRIDSYLQEDKKS